METTKKDKRRRMPKNGAQQKQRDVLAQLLEADRKAARRVDDARKKAEEMVTQAEKEVAEQAETAERKARKEAETIVDDARNAASPADDAENKPEIQDVDALQRKALDNMDRAVEMLVKRVTGENG